MSRRLRTALTVTDQFCGAGGSSIGAVAAGAELRMAMNHWKLAIDTHASNFRDAEHVCADIHSVDPRRFAPTDILITSPECTNHSLAKSKPRSAPLFEPPEASAERSRATMWDEPRFAEHHGYQIVIVENVVEVTRWPPFSAWLAAMDALGYAHRIVSLNSFAAPPTPQSRDRIYVVFWRMGNRAPDLDIHPPSWCPKCEAVVAGIQSWKGTRRVGKYRQQYVYRCGACTTEAFPFVAPASTGIDFTLPAGRIGDREHPLKPATMRRIEEGLDRYVRPFLPQIGGHSFARPGYVRAWPTDQPAPTQMATPHHGLVVPSGGTWRRDATPTSDPFPTTMPRDTHGLLVPLGQGAHPDSKRARPTSEPMGAQTARQDTALVIDMREGERRSRPVSQPAGTVVAAGVTQALLVPLRTNGRAKLTDGAPAPAFCAGGTHHALVMGNRTGGKARPAAEVPAPTLCTGETIALIFGGYGGNTKDGGTRPATEPATPITANDHHALLVPYYGTGVARPTDVPMGAVTTRDRHALVKPSLDVNDCTFRMLEPPEIQNFMAFPADYIVLGNKRDRVRQLGNAVTPPVMAVLIRRCVESLDGSPG